MERWSAPNYGTVVLPRRRGLTGLRRILLLDLPHCRLDDRAVLRDCRVDIGLGQPDALDAFHAGHGADHLRHRARHLVGDARARAHPTSDGPLRLASRDLTRAATEPADLIA